MSSTHFHQPKGWSLRILPLFLLLPVSIFAGDRKPVSSPQPEYPAIARRMHISGTVRVQVVIAPNGTITSAKILGGNPLLAESVQRALQKWKYAPSETETTKEITFQF